MIFSNSWQDHLKHLKYAISTLEKKGFTIKLSKCHFARDSVEFLGHRVGNGKIQPQQAKIQAIQEFQVPTTKKALRAFLGLLGYYRRFIPDFANRSAILTDLTRKQHPDRLNWTEAHQNAFQELQQALVDAPVLLPPDPNLPYVLTTDASGRGIGSILSQIVQGDEHPIAYFSRKLLPREERYAITELEALAVVASVKHFAPYLLGADFVVITDHRPLTFLTTMKNGGPRLTRWALALQPFSFTVVHRPGAANSNADGLSRQDWPDTTVPDETLSDGDDGERQTPHNLPGLSSLEGGGGVGSPPQQHCTPKQTSKKKMKAK